MCRQQADLQASLYSLAESDDESLDQDGESDVVAVQQRERRERPETAVYETSPINPTDFPSDQVPPVAESHSSVDS
jgi:hypothetical protein